ncbi:TRAP transporter substrate-binding protein DctP [Geoalkalibacter halelectricus]|uniref:TRAP transporter substrate-binding protein DctP n=1 Tax=Geoalkalibacter halelectricus TaxID=2847045 RepID=A0ABY5ZJX1_9BACT|nr:TRAP transporter substrate-binding protein DctP [Geoalkalibacter halelectricus]MDO3380290.1 TRAP transporter substrate-binding protein DctP [Geoalkalibacter halelectricus]UWZ79442.1 TRAP transporter substrate-binding protein DctP [Geoalkalibacter halelectricus]
MKKGVFRGFLVALLMGLFLSSSVHAAQFRMLSAWAPNYVFNVGVLTSFEKNLAELSGGKMRFNVLGPDVVPTFEQLQPVQAGIFDMAYTYSAYHSGTTPIAIGMDATTADPVKRREAGLFDFVDKEYNKIGIKLVSFPPLTPYHFVTRNALNGRQPSLQGMKLRSIPSLQSLILNLGGSPVTMAGGEIYTSLQRGVIDGAPWTQVGVKDFKLNEVANYMVRPEFGYVSTMILMNLRKYNSLTPEQRAWIDEAGRKTELDSLAFFQELIAEEVAELKSMGMKITEMHPNDAAMVEKYWNDGLWEMAKASTGAAGKKFHELALETGMTK